jgi:hypothetical protein
MRAAGVRWLLAATVSRLAAITNDSRRMRAKGTFRAIDTAGDGTYCQAELQIVIGSWGSGLVADHIGRNQAVGSLWDRSFFPPF